MKNIAILVIILIAAPQAFTDDRTDIFENNYFQWQLYTKKNMDMDFTNINPLFFNSEGNFFNDLSFIETSTQDNAQSNTVVHNYSGGDGNWCDALLFWGVYLGALFSESYAYPQNYNYINRKEILDKKIEEYKLYERITGNYRQ